MKEFLNFINGEYVRNASGKTFQDINPVNGSVIGNIYEAGEVEVNAAVAAAKSALKGDWGRLSVAERCKLLDAVAVGVNAESVRPMTDNVTVQSASIVDYTVEAELVIYPGPDPAPVLESALAALQKYTEAQRRIGYEVSLSGIYAALHQPGVQRVNLTSPVADLVIGEGESAYCTSVDVTVSGSTDV